MSNVCLHGSNENKSLSTSVVGLLAIWRDKELSLRVSQMFVPGFSALLAEQILLFERSHHEVDQMSVIAPLKRLPLNFSAFPFC